MRTLVIATTVATALLGGAVGLAWHYARFLHGSFAWVAYAPTGGPLQVDTGSWTVPLLAGLVAGALAGLGAGLLLVRTGWRLVRTAGHGS